MSTSCGVEEDTWRTGTIVCGSVHIGWGVIVTIAAIVLMAYAHLNATAFCSAFFNDLNVTYIEDEANSHNLNYNVPGYYNSTIGFSEEVCVQTAFLITIALGVVVFIISLLFHIVPGALGVCGAQNKSTGLVCAFIVCLVIILIIDLAGIVSSIVVLQDKPGDERVTLIISVVGIVLTLLGIVVTGNYRTAVKQDENTVALI